MSDATKVVLAVVGGAAVLGGVVVVNLAFA